MIFFGLFQLKSQKNYCLLRELVLSLIEVTKKLDIATIKFLIATDALISLFSLTLLKVVQVLVILFLSYLLLVNFLLKVDALPCGSTLTQIALFSSIF